MSPDDVKGVRKALGCTARELAAALEVEPDVVTAWERGELFPTKRHVGMLEELARKGPSAVPRKPRKAAANTTPIEALADPALWLLVRKILAHPELRAAAEDVARAYPDPAAREA